MIQQMWEIWSVNSLDSDGFDLTPFFKIDEYEDFTKAYLDFRRLLEKGDYIMIPKSK